MRRSRKQIAAAIVFGAFLGTIGAVVAVNLIVRLIAPGEAFSGIDWPIYIL